MEGGQEAFPIKAMPRAPFTLKPKPSDPHVCDVCSDVLSLQCQLVGSDLLGLAAQVVVVSHGDDTEQHPTEEQEHGGVGQDAHLH